MVQQLLLLLLLLAIESACIKVLDSNVYPGLGFFGFFFLSDLANYTSLVNLPITVICLISLFTKRRMILAQ